VLLFGRIENRTVPTVVVTAASEGVFDRRRCRRWRWACAAGDRRAESASQVANGAAVFPKTVTSLARAI